MNGLERWLIARTELIVTARLMKERGLGVAEIGGKKMVGELGQMFDDIRKAVEAAKLGIVGAAAELMTEVKDMKPIETAIRSEAKSVRDFKTQLLGNAVAGENQEEDKTLAAVKPPELPPANPAPPQAEQGTIPPQGPAAQANPPIGNQRQFDRMG